jgi:putative ABC transport system permease protein
MESLLQDLSHAARTLLRQPRFAVATLLTLVLGIGMAGAVFSIVDAVLLRPLPYHQPERLVRLWNHFHELTQVRASDPEFFHYQDLTRTFEKLGAFVTVDLNLTGGDEPERVKGVFANADLLPLLGVPALPGGRHLSPEDDAPGARPVVVLSYGLWQRRFDGRPDTVGQTVQVNGVPRQVVGIMPSGFGFPGKTDLWMPLGLDRASPGPDSQRYLEVIGRLKPGVSLAQNQADLAGYVKQTTEQLGLPADLGWGVDSVPLLDQEVGQAKKILWVLLGAVGLLLLITAANVANILLTRLAARDREIALRAALGAGKGRLARQVLSESLLLAVIGGALGLLLGHLAVRAFVAANPGSIPRAAEVALDGRVVLFTLGVALATGLLIGLLPALRAGRPDLVNSLKEGGKTTGGPAGQRPRRLLVVAEVALAVVLLAGAALLVRSFLRLSQVDPGFRPQGVATLQVALPRSKYPEPASVAQQTAAIRGRLAALPGVRSADLINHLPFAGSNVSSSVLLEGQPFNPTDPHPEPDLRSVTPGYFATLGIPVVRGRAFTDSDDAGKPPVAVADETLARLLWPGQDPVGKRLRLIPVMPGQETPLLTVVGVVRPIRGASLAAVEPRGQLYFPQSQSPERVVYFALRTGGDPLSVVPAARGQIRALDPDVPLADVQTMDSRLEKALAQPRFAMQLLALFAAVALALAAVGVYGVVADSVARRSREIGIRMALGSERRAILAGVLRREMATVASGVALGLVGAVFAARLLGSQLYEIGTADPVSFALVALGLLGVALAAALGPAWKAARTPPAAVLRLE